MIETDKVLGCILGGAIGDAMGGAYEGQTPPVKTSGDEIWRLSDDTQLTLATCEAVIERNGRVDPASIAGRFAVWHKASRVSGMGASTYKALTELVHGGHWALVGNKGERAAGNGAAMRIAPLAFCLDPKHPSDRQIIRDVSRITHHHEEAYVGALAVVLAVRGAWTGAWDGGDDLLNMVAGELPGSVVRDKLLDFTALGDGLSLSEIGVQFGCSGYVADSVPLALKGAQLAVTGGFRNMLCKLIGVGGDTDTIASIAGQVAGTLIGVHSIPEEMLTGLPNLQLCERIALQFAQTVTGSQDG